MLMKPTTLLFGLTLFLILVIEWARFTDYSWVEDIWRHYNI